MAAAPHLQIADIWIDVSIRETHNGSAELTRHPVELGADITDHVRLMPDQLTMEGVITNQPIEVPQSHLGGALGSEQGFVIEAEPTNRDLPNMVTILGEPSLGVLGLIPGASQGAALLGAAGIVSPPRRQFGAQLHKGNTAAQKARYQVSGLKFSQAFDRVKAVDEALQAAFRGRKPVQIITGLRVYDAMVITDLSIMREASNGGTLRFGATAESLRVIKSDSAQVGTPDPVDVRAKPKVDKGNQSAAPTADGSGGEVSESAAHKAKEMAKQILGL